MKLPADPKMRTQLLILAAICGIVFLVLGYFGLSALLTQRAELRLKLQAAQDQLEKIDREIKALPTFRQTRDELFLSLQKTAADHVLYHEYRNYHLTARERLLPLATEFDIAIDIPREGTVLDFPIADSTATDKPVKAQAKNPRDYAGTISSTFALYSVTLTGKAGFIPLLAFIRRMEESNPYLTVSELIVTADSLNPEAHAFTVTVLWPIWKNLETKPKTEDLIQPILENAQNPPQD